MDNLRFRSNVGDQPWFFVPDTGAAGGSAVLTTPDGGDSPCDEMQVTQKGDRVGFKVPSPFSVEGEHRLTVTQDDVVTTYEIEVLPRPEEG